MSGPIILYGATVERSQDDTTYTAIPSVKTVEVPAEAVEYVETTSLDSTGGFREFIPGLIDTGEVSMTCNYTADGYEQQIADRDFARTGGPCFYRLTFKAQPGQSAGDVVAFRAYPNPSVTSGDIGGVVDMTITLRTTGAPTYTRGAAAV